MIMRRYISLLLVCVPAGAMAQDAPLRLTISKGLRVASPAQSQASLRTIPGAADVLLGSQWHNSRALTVKDMVDYTPGVFAQPRNGAESARLSIRGSGLNRTFQGRGLL
ncbi:MAG: Plug domain-containing protein, partial [Proteobacteria bacterium]|nr:Plug domain-containing protein [Pseudomonadota bacterium]